MESLVQQTVDHGLRRLILVDRGGEPAFEEMLRAAARWLSMARSFRCAAVSEVPAPTMSVSAASSASIIRAGARVFSVVR